MGSISLSIYNKNLKNGIYNFPGAQHKRITVEKKADKFAGCVLAQDTQAVILILMCPAQSTVYLSSSLSVAVT